MEGDKFISSGNSTNPKEKDDNFFIQTDYASMRQPSSEQQRKHINDYDFNILKEDAYKEVDDKILKLEYKISKAEAEIKDLSAQIQAARDINDYDLAESLMAQKKNYEEDLASLVSMYKDASLSTKISSGLTNKISKKFSGVKDYLTSVSDSLLSRLPGKFSNLVEIKNSLTKLENINKSVDELMNMHIPYGESVEKYDQLSKYILKANSIQSEISKIMK